MVNLDVRMRSVAVSNAVQEIVMMGNQVGRARIHGFDQLVAWAVNLEATALAENEHSFSSIKRISVLKPLLHVRRPNALLKNQLPFLRERICRRIFIDHVLGIRPLLVVVKEIL